MVSFTREEVAEKYFKESKNCALAILLTFEDKIHLSITEIQAMTAGFEKGMFVSDTCGAVTGAVMFLGILLYDKDTLKVIGRRKISKNTRKFINEFQKKNKSINCKKLKKEYKCNCNELVKNAVKNLETMI